MRRKKLTIFSPTHFLRLVSIDNLRDFFNAHPISKRITINWNIDKNDLPNKINAAITKLIEVTATSDSSDSESISISHDINLWHDDLLRVHLLANDLAINEFYLACSEDKEVLEAFSSRDLREKAMWIFHARDKLFRDVELNLAFLAKTNGKFWKKHRIESELQISDERSKLENFSCEVAKLFEKSGGGKSTHVERSTHRSNGSIQVTIFVEGPITAFAHFTKNKFNRVTTRIALETALVYHPATGIIESVIKGGAKNHQALLQLLGKFVIGKEIEPKEIEKTRFKLNELRNGLETFEDLSRFGIEKIRLRRAQFRPRSSTGIAIRVEASPEQGQDDAIELAHKTLQYQHSLATEYNLDGATILIYKAPTESQKSKRFSFDLYSSGSSTIKNLSEKNQSTANAVLQALNVIEPEEAII